MMRLSGKLRPETITRQSDLVIEPSLNTTWTTTYIYAIKITPLNTPHKGRRNGPISRRDQKDSSRHSIHLWIIAWSYRLRPPRSRRAIYCAFRKGFCVQKATGMSFPHFCVHFQLISFQLWRLYTAFFFGGEHFCLRRFH
jgi:hypothetical protein